MAGMLFASHPTPVREAIEALRKQFDEDPVGAIAFNLLLQRFPDLLQGVEHFPATFRRPRRHAPRRYKVAVLFRVQAEPLRRPATQELQRPLGLAGPCGRQLRRRSRRVIRRSSGGVQARACGRGHKPSPIPR